MNESIWHYNNPAAAYLFLLFPLLGLLAWFGEVKKAQELAQLGSPSVRRQEHDSSFKNRSRWRMIFLGLAGLWTVVTLMDPYEENIAKNARENKAERTAVRMNQEIWILLDTSGSMGVHDEEGGQTRLESAKKTIEELLRLSAGRPVRLYTFNSKADLLVPLTWDQLFVQLTVQNLTLDPAHPRGTDMASLFETVNQARLAHRFFTNNALILLTDGGDTAWELAQGEAKQKRLQALRALTRKEHADLFIVGFGSAGGGIVPGVLYDGKPLNSKLDDTLLKALTSPDRLFFSATHSPYQLAEVLKERIDHMLSYETTKEHRPSAGIQTKRFMIPLTLALICLLTALAIPGIADKRKSLPQRASL